MASGDGVHVKAFVSWNSRRCSGPQPLPRQEFILSPEWPFGSGCPKTGIYSPPASSASSTLRAGRAGAHRVGQVMRGPPRVPIPMAAPCGARGFVHPPPAFLSGENILFVQLKGAALSHGMRFKGRIASDRLLFPTPISQERAKGSGGIYCLSERKCHLLSKAMTSLVLQLEGNYSNP